MKIMMWSKKNFPLYMCKRIKSRAKDKGYRFNLTEEDFSQLPTHCPVLGLKLVYGNIGKKKDNSASVDRFDNTKGYIKGNIRIISKRANELKSNGTLEEFRQIVTYLKSEGDA